MRCYDYYCYYDNYYRYHYYYRYYYYYHYYYYYSPNNDYHHYRRSFHTLDASVYVCCPEENVLYVRRDRETR